MLDVQKAVLTNYLKSNLTPNSAKNYHWNFILKRNQIMRKNPIQKPAIVDRIQMRSHQIPTIHYFWSYWDRWGFHASEYGHSPVRVFAFARWFALSLHFPFDIGGSNNDYEFGRNSTFICQSRSIFQLSYPDKLISSYTHSTQIWRRVFTNLCDSFLFIFNSNL